MDFLPFGILRVGDCFRLGSSLVSYAFDGHLLRKIGALRAEYVDGSGTVVVPEGTLVRTLPPAHEVEPAT